MRGGTIGGHLAACSVLRSSAYRKYASSLRTCARDDLTPAPASAPGPARNEEGGIASLAAIQDFIPSASPQRHMFAAASRWWSGGVKHPESRRAQRCRAPRSWRGRRRSREEGPDRLAHSAAGRKRTSCTLTTEGASTSRDGPSSRDREWGGASLPLETEPYAPKTPAARRESLLY